MKKQFILNVLAVMTSTAIYAQSIPNAGFENWTNQGTYVTPDNWSCLNSLTFPMGVFTCAKGTPGSPGTAYLKLTSKSVSGMGVVPGIAVSGLINTTTMQPQSGFAFNQQPASLTGKWQHMIFGSSQGSVDVQLTRWDMGMQMRMPVASAHLVLSGMAMSWTNFTIPLVYSDFSAPDSCIITFAASGANPTDGDYLYIDNLAFVGNVTALANLKQQNSVRIFPNPVINKINIAGNHADTQKMDVVVLDLAGNILSAQSSLDNSAINQVDVENLPKGFYVLKMISADSIQVFPFVKM